MAAVNVFQNGVLIPLKAEKWLFGSDLAAKPPFVLPIKRDMHCYTQELVWLLG
ncbi:hypothetical protein [Pantoea cypripedii]|jgi:hypothetical protein|uniref:hypothetical protein n=1 Tax=Pantoea cypripedii TaxID=55209 RepID=UPI001ABFE3D2|nr:hypothetical protein [Pantoea cypripedii]